LTDLERDLVAERAALSSPSEAMAPSATSAAAPGVAQPIAETPTAPPPNLDLPAPPASTPAAVETASPAMADAPVQDPPLVRRPWFWAAVGAALVGGTVAILVATKSDKDPTATLGTFPAN
jgi:hypothetical protein